MSKQFEMLTSMYGWPTGTIVTEVAADPGRTDSTILVETDVKGYYKHGAGGHNSQPDGMYGAWVRKEFLAEVKPEVHTATAVPEATVTRKRLTIDKIGVGQTFIIHGQPETVYVKISNSHVFNHKRLQMHTTVAERFTKHLNLVAVELVVFNGK